MPIITRDGKPIVRGGKILTAPGMAEGCECCHNCEPCPPTTNVYALSAALPTTISLNGQTCTLFNPTAVACTSGETPWDETYIFNTGETCEWEDANDNYPFVNCYQGKLFGSRFYKDAGQWTLEVTVYIQQGPIVVPIAWIGHLAASCPDGVYTAECPGMVPATYEITKVEDMP